MAPIQDFQKKIELRLLEEVKKAGWRANASLVFAFFMVFTMVFLVIVGQVFFYSRRVVSPLVRLNEAVSHLTIQEKEDKLLEFDDGSEISVLAQSIKYFHHNAILAGELQQFRLRIAEITVELYKAQDLATLTQTAMNQISLFLDVHHGLLYVADEEEQCLTLMGGYGVSVDNVGQKVVLGEGLVGQCALSKAPMQMNNPPENYIKIASATGSAIPACILIQPLILNNHLLGVIELAAFRQFNENDQMALAEISLALAMSIEILSHKEV
jgi:nitrate/nitrite-specific signal transduction histidine kinase